MCTISVQIARYKSRSDFCCNLWAAAYPTARDSGRSECEVTLPANTSGRLSVAGDSNLLAHVEDRAGAAFGQVSGADMFPEWDQKAVELNPMFAGQLFVQQCHCFLWRASGDVSPAIRHTMDVDVDSDPWLAARNAEH